METAVHTVILASAFIVALALGVSMHKFRFCTMGAVSDWINMGHRGRLGAWLFAMAIAMGGVLVLEASGVVALQNGNIGAFPPYRSPQFAWLRYLVGGLLFGIGMTVAGGCVSRTVVRVGGGSLKSLVVLAVVAVTSYLMLWTSFYQKAFQFWIEPTTVQLARWDIPDQTVGAIVAGVFGMTDWKIAHVVIGVIIVVTLLVLLFRLRDFRAERANIFAGAAVGTAILAGFTLTGGPLSEAWGEYAMIAEQPPIRVAVQSFTFTSPTGDTLNYLLRPSSALVSFGMVSLLGVLLGSFLYALLTRQLRLEWFKTVTDFVNHVIGGVLMGIGGVLALGCTIGQGVTGVSTLALGSLLAVAAMIFGSAFTMKAIYYRLGGNPVFCALRLAAADFKLATKPRQNH